MNDLEDKVLYMYTDGSYNHDADVGGAAAVILYDNNPNARPKTYKNVSQAFKRVSACKTELIAVYAGLTAINGKCKKLTIFTDQIHLDKHLNNISEQNRFILEQIKKELERKAETYYIKYLPSYSGNKFGNIAHNLANKARKDKENNG